MIIPAFLFELKIFIKEVGIIKMFAADKLDGMVAALTCELPSGPKP